ncbi:YheC/YheD family endospore coat-associated protein [Bacillus massiliglaciei]|uniref:YheC/YheD family endospore coat-associated protein n=1 Tax=Bacillus massiliglaciei TaxID=1816693 RepID=UPI000A8B00F3|nr:YheC/YheD family protein [Bacillus massiliglaciei]
MKPKIQKAEILPEELKQTKAAVGISAGLLIDRGLKEGQSVIVKAGHRSISAEIQSLNVPGVKLCFSRSARQFLCLPHFEYPVSIEYCETENTLVISTFLAIVTNQSLQKDQTFGPMDKFFREMGLYSRMKGYTLYIACPQDCSDQKIQGVWENAGQWEETDMPLAEAFYNRIHSRRLERGAAFSEFTKQLAEQGIPIFNGSFLAKHDVHAILSNEPISSYIPATIPLYRPESILPFLNEYPVLFLKPTFGSQGRNICKLTKKGTDFSVEHSTHPHENRGSVSLDEVLRLIRKLCQKQAYIVQEGIYLFEDEGKKFDFRFLLHREQEDWKVSSSTARLGDQNQIVSNIAQGAEMIKALNLLTSLFDRSEAYQLYQELKELALAAARLLSGKHPSLLGELGIDLALDREKKPWIIEINSKPSKKYEGEYERYRPSVKPIIEYMKYLTSKKSP